MNRVTNGKGNNRSRDSWETPQWLFDVLRKQYRFRLDCCASYDNSKCNNYYSDIQKFESVNKIFSDYLPVWMNPPFSIADRMFKHFFKVVEQGIAIYRCDNLETKIWQKTILPNASWIFIFNKRINYEGADGSGARFPSALIGLNLPVPELLEGITLKI